MSEIGFYFACLQSVCFAFNSIEFSYFHTPVRNHRTDEMKHGHENVLNKVLMDFWKGKDTMGILDIKIDQELFFHSQLFLTDNLNHFKLIFDPILKRNPLPSHFDYATIKMQCRLVIIIVHPCTFDPISSALQRIAREMLFWVYFPIQLMLLISKNWWLIDAVW